ncbi:MAG: MFS transporter [Acidimicrobiia bacterium]
MNGLGRNFRKLWTASAVSNLGDGVRLAALPLLAATLTRDPALVAGLTVMLWLPWLLLSLVAGAVVDQVDRRRLMAAAQGLRMMVVALLGGAVWMGWAGLPLLYAVAFLMGAAETLFDTAAQAIIPSVVAPSQLEPANARLIGAEIVANQFVGPPLGAVLFGLAAAVPFLFDAATFAVAAFLLVALQGSFRPIQDDTRRRLGRRIYEGLTWLGRHRLLRAVTFMVALVNLFYASTSAIFVLFALEILGLDELGFGVLLAMFAVGASLGTVAAHRVTQVLGPGTVALTAFSVGGAAQIAIGLFSRPVAVGAMLVVQGIGFAIFNVTFRSLRQAVVPDTLLGRVVGSQRALGYGAIPAGAALGGLMARALGLRAPFLVAGVALVLVALVSTPFVNNRAIAEAS